MFSWHKVYIWTFKSRYANRCLLSNSITKPDFTWVRKILFPSFFIFFTWRLHFTVDDSPWTVIRKECEMVEVAVLSVRGECMHFRWALLPRLRPQNANETGHYFSVLVSRPLSPQILTHCEFAVFCSDSVCMCLVSGQILFSRIGGIVYLLVDFSFECRWDEMNDSFRRFLSSSCVYYS